MPLNCEGITHGLQILFAPDFPSFTGGECFRQICRILGRPGYGAPVLPVIGTREWLESGLSAQQLSLALAIAVAESAPLATVTEATTHLESRFQKLIGSESDAPTGRSFADLIGSRTKRLEAVGAVRYQETHGRLRVNIECVRRCATSDICKVTERTFEQPDELGSRAGRLCRAVATQPGRGRRNRPLIRSGHLTT